jgi:Mn2+/Fe2+ NRAMP family transporter
MAKSLRSTLSSLGPGLITAAVVLGPGSISMVSMSGSKYGYKLIWVVVASGIIMGTYTVMAARIGTLSDKTLLSQVQTLYGRWLAILMGIAAFLVCASFQAGNNVGVSITLQSIFGDYFPSIAENTMLRTWSAAFTLITIAFVLFARNLYKLVERLMIVLVLVMICCFVVNLIPARPSIGGIAMGLLPTAGEEHLFLMIPIVATTFSVIAALYQSYVVQNRGWKIEDYKTGIVDALTGIGVLGTLSIVIMITAAAILKPQGIVVTSAGDMATQLEPLLGSTAKMLFCIGLWGASFSSLVANAIIGGGLLTDGLGLGWKFENLSVKLATVGVMLIGALVNHCFAGMKLSLIVCTQALTILLVPMCALVLLLLANNKKVMGEHKNGLWINVLGVIGFVVLTSLAVYKTYMFIG